MDIKWFIIGFFVCPTFSAALIGLWISLVMWRLNRETKRQVQAQVEQRVSEPVPIKRDTSSAVALMDQVDMLIKRMDEAELDADIDEMQMRGW